MIKRLFDNEKGKVIEYIYEQRLKNFYLYMDLLSCGCEEDGLGLWVKEKNKDILFVIYQYNDCIHLYGHMSEMDKEVVAKVFELKPGVISGPTEIINAIYKECDVSKWDFEHNYVVTADKKMEYTIGNNMIIKKANDSEIAEIAKIMMKSDVYSRVSTYESLCHSMLNRNKQGFGRVFVLIDEDIIVASNATNAETKDMAVIGGLITDPEKRGKGYGQIITAYTWNLIRDEGKVGLGHILEDNVNSIKLHTKMGYSFIGKNARIIRKKE